MPLIEQIPVHCHDKGMGLNPWLEPSVLWTSLECSVSDRMAVLSIFRMYSSDRIMIVVKSREESNLLTKSHHEELLNYQSETELLAKNHESEKQVRDKTSSLLSMWQL